ncbi:MAG: antibiotic biosynthesis monooxygenase, partial [Sciscionella sp.]
MPIYPTARYQVRAEAVERVTTAIEEVAAYVAQNEPGSRRYPAWEGAADLTKFAHLFIVEDEAAHQARASSDAVARFEAVCWPELAAGPVVFTGYQLVAANNPRPDSA